MRVGGKQIGVRRSPSLKIGSVRRGSDAFVKDRSCSEKIGKIREWASSLRSYCWTDGRHLDRAEHGPGRTLNTDNTPGPAPHTTTIRYNTTRERGLCPISAWLGSVRFGSWARLFTMSRAALQPSQQKLAEKLTILNDRGVGMLTRIYNIKKVRRDHQSREIASKKHNQTNTPNANANASLLAPQEMRKTRL